MHYFGAELRRLRERDGLSQADLGRRLMQSTDLVRRVEDGSRIASLAFVEACDDVFDARGGLRRLWPLLDRERRLRLDRRDAAWSTGDYRSSAADRLVLDWLVIDGHGPGRTGLPAAVEVLSELRHRDHQVGGGGVYESVTAVIGSDLDAMVVNVPRLAIGFLELAGYDAVDLGADGRAQAHYLQALRIANRAGDLVYGGYLIAVSLAHLALHCGDAGQALRLVTAALRGTGRAATPAVRAAFHTVAARAYARLGEEVRCTAELRRAEADFLLVDPDGEPEWIRYFGAADFADERAHCFFDLGHHDLVDRELDVAVALLPPTRIRRLAIDTALRSSSLARRGEIEQACVVGTAAVDYAAATMSFRSAHRIALMLAEVQPLSAQRCVADLTEYARSKVPEAPTIPASQVA